MRQIGFGIVDGLVLADKAAQFLADFLRARISSLGSESISSGRIAQAVPIVPARRKSEHHGQHRRNARAMFHLFNFSAIGSSRSRMMSGVNGPRLFPADHSLLVDQIGFRHAVDAEINPVCPFASTATIP